MGRAVLAFASVLCLSACAEFQGAPLVSGQSPQNQSSASEPQPINSVPPGFAGIGNGPNAVAPNFASLTFRTPF